VLDGRLWRHMLKNRVYQPFSAGFGHGLVALMANGVTMWGHGG
jgi:hypothetical protein